MFHPDTFTARWITAARETLTPGRVVGYGAAALAGFFLAAILFDPAIGDAARDWPERERDFFRWLTDFGKSDWILIPSLLAWAVGTAAHLAPLDHAWESAARGTKLLGALFFIGVGLPGLVTVVLKRIVGRERPYVDDATGLSFTPFDLFDYTVHSFPSGHSTTAIAMAVVLFTLTNGRLRGALLVLGALIGLSRIVVGDHYFTDVVGGLIVGTLVAFAVRDYFATRGWGVVVDNGRVVSSIHEMFEPLVARYSRSK